MAALTGDRNTLMRSGEVVSLPVAGGKKIYAGALVARDANGYAIPGATATGILGVGRAESQVDNSSGADGDLTVEVRKGVFRFDNDATDPVGHADVGNDCYIVDDQTVAKTDGTGTRSVAGKVFDVDSDGVWVKFE
jgi:predicted ThiF/HesA family dinucleotide-utilizing enzyme